MNVIFLYANIIDPQKGGIQRTTANLADYFVGEGHTVYYISLNKKGDQGNFSNRQILLPDNNKFDTKANRSFFESFIVDNAIDVVIDQGARHPHSFKLVKIAKECGCRVYGVHHTTPLGMPNNFYAIYKYRVPSFFRGILKITEVGFIKGVLTKLFVTFNKVHFHKYCEICDKYVLLSETFVEEFLQLTGGKYRDKVVYIANSIIDNNVELPLRKELELLHVGRVKSQKRVDLLLKIWQILQNDNLDWRLTIVGSGEDIDYIKDYATKLKLERVCFEGFQEPTKYYQRASIFCMTSPYEGFGMVLIEAMQYGVVPFAFNSYASVVDIIDNGINGFLIKPFDVDEYAKQLHAVMNNESILKEFSERAVEKSKLFSIDKIGEQWLKLINDEY